MTRPGLLLYGLAIGLLAFGARAHAESAKDAIQVSVRVVRSCKVQTTVPAATVDCGRPASGSHAAPRTPMPMVRTIRSTSSPTTTTINF